MPKHIVPVQGRLVDINDIIRHETIPESYRTENGKLTYDYRTTFANGEVITMPKKDGYYIEKLLRKRK